MIKYLVFYEHKSEYCNKNSTPKNVWAHILSKGSFEVVKKFTKHMLIDSSSKLSTLDFMRTHKRIYAILILKLNTLDYELKHT